MKHIEAMELALEAAYLAGFNASGEGYNGEYGIDCPEENAIWKKDRDNELKAIKQAIAAPAGHRDRYWCVDLTCKKCYSADFRLKHTTPPAQPAPVHLVARIEPVNDTDSAYAYADGWNACVEHHKYIAKNAPEKGQS